MPIKRTRRDDDGLTLERARETILEASLLARMQAIRRSSDAFDERLTEAFWTELECACNTHFEAVGRAYIHGVLTTYSSKARSTWNDNKRKKRKRNSAVKRATKLADYIEGELDDFQLVLGDCSKHVLFGLLREFIEGEKKSSGRAGNRDHADDQGLVHALAAAYHHAGGNPTRSVDGPFGKFLQHIWTVLPPERRSNGREAFAALSKNLSPSKLKKIRTLPRGFPGD